MDTAFYNAISYFIEMVFSDSPNQIFLANELFQNWNVLIVIPNSHEVIRVGLDWSWYQNG